MKAGRAIAHASKNRQSASPANQATYWSYQNIRITEKGVSEVAGGRRMLFIPKEQIQYMETKFGSHAERPVVQMVAGLLLVAGGLVGLYMALVGGIRGLYWGVGLLGFGAIGVYCFYESFKKGHFVSVICAKDTRKLKLTGQIQNEEFLQFVKDASALGYDIRRSSDTIICSGR